MATISHYAVHSFRQSLQGFRQFINCFQKPVQERTLFFDFHIRFQTTSDKIFGKNKVFVPNK